MQIDTRDDFFQTLRMGEPLDLVQTYLAQLDSPPFLSDGHPLTPLLIQSFNAPNRSFLGAEVTKLSDCGRAAEDISLAAALNRRKSRIFYLQAPVAESDFSTLLKTAIGLSGGTLASGQHGRVYPSGGGLYPVEPYVLVKNVSGIAEGAYHYSVLDHQLENVYAGPIELSEYLFDQSAFLGGAESTLKNVAFVVVLTCYMKKSYYKYGDRAWKLMLLEAGHIAQNLYLVSTALGNLGIVALGGFHQDPLCKLLGLDGYSELVVYPLQAGPINTP